MERGPYAQGSARWLESSAGPRRGAFAIERAGQARIERADTLRTLVHRSPARKHSRGSLMRTPTLLAVGMAGLWLGAGCSNPMGVIPPPSDRNFVLVDQFPAWTPDGAALYFHRGFASSLGPPGLYRTTWAGDTTTPVGVGDRTGPIKLRVSPDGS